MGLFSKKSKESTPSTVKVADVEKLYKEAIGKNRRNLTVALKGSVPDSFIEEVRQAITCSDPDWRVTHLLIDVQGNLQINMKPEGKKRSTLVIKPIISLGDNSRENFFPD
jgi:hypothetical protein